jgi:type IV pilus assembly protein PilA
MLARLRKRIDEKEEGFTLIELLVVIIIIGILAAIAIPVFLSQKSKGYEASLKSDLRTVASDIESQNTDKADYTTVTFGAGTLTGTTTSISGSGVQNVGDDKVSLSAGNTITVGTTTNASSFCLVGVATKASPAVTFYWNTAKGGLQPKGTTSC